MKHNNVCDFKAKLLKTTLNDTRTELNLQKIDNKELNSLTGDNPTPYKRACGVCNQGQNAFFDIRWQILMLVYKITHQ